MSLTLHKKVYHVVIAMSIILLAIGTWYLFTKSNNEHTSNQVPSVEKSLDSYSTRAKIGLFNLRLEIATTTDAQSIGLGGREEMPSNAGMLFVFDPPEIPSFWMQDMLFPIDIVWFDENLKVIEITHDVAPETYPNTYEPKGPIKYALELNAGTAMANNIVIGNVLSLI